MGFEIELDDGSNRVVVAASDIQSLSLPRRHSVINGWQATTAKDLAVEDWTQAEAYFFYENDAQNIPRQLVYRGEYERPETTDSESTTTLHGKDVTRKLDRGGVEVSYSSLPYWRAIKQFWQDETSWNANVVEPTPEVVDDGVTVQDTSDGDTIAGLFAPAGDKPIGVVNGSLVALQSCFTQEGESFTGDATGDPNALSTYSNGDAARLDSAGDTAEWTFTPQYDIPADHVGVKVRDHEHSGSIGVDWSLNGDQIDAVPDDANLALDWTDVGSGSYSASAGYEGGTLEAGTEYTLTAECTGGSGASYIVDVVAPYDTRYSYFFDNDNGGNSGYLDGPETKPDSVSTVSAPYSSTFNIAESSLTTTIDDVSNSQSLQVSNDGGDNYYPQDGSESNTESVAVDFSTQDSYGTTVRSKVTLSRYGSRTDQTPKQGFKGQSLSEFTLDVTTNTLSVIDDRSFGPATPYEVAQRLHQDSGFRFVPHYRENELFVESFARGDVTKSLDVVEKDHTRTTPDKPYANSVTVYGAEDDQGNRLTATAESQPAIDRDGDVIEAPAITRTSVDSKGDLKSIARTELARHLDNDELTGMLEVWPQILQPGYSYQVDSLDGETLALERVDFSYGVRGERGQLDFAGLSEIATELTSLKADINRN